MERSRRADDAMESSGTTSMRKQLLSTTGTVLPSRDLREIPVKEIATLFVSSEATGHPAEYAFDDSRGLGATRWIAGEPGE